MTDRRSYVLVTFTILALGVALRAIPLYWSPDPATLDGLQYAALTRETIASGGHLPVHAIDADEIGFSSTMTLVTLVTGSRPLTVAQPLVSVLGATAPLLWMAFTRRTARSWGWSRRRTRLAVVLVGLALTLDGLYLRRTGVPDEEAVGLLLVPMLAYSVHLALARRERRWFLLTALLMAVFPLVHNFGSLIALLCVTAVAGLHVVSGRSRTRVALALLSAGAFWLYFWGYFTVADRLGLGVTYRGLVADHAGLLLAWLIVLVTGVLWFRRTTTRARQLAYTLPFAFLFLLVFVNAVKPVFPGTITSPTVVLLLILPFAIPIFLANRTFGGFGVGIGDIASDGTGVGDGGVDVAADGDRAWPVVLVTLVGPVVLTFYLLTAELTPVYFDAVIRSQTFFHPAVFTLAGLGVARCLPSSSVSTRRLRRWGSVALVAFFVVGVAVTTPLAFVDLDTVTYPSTITQAEFGSASFVVSHVEGPVATDYTLSRMGKYYYGTSDQFAMGPTQTWLEGGPKPTCAVLSQRSWTETGAHLYPASPAKTTPRRYRALVTNRSVVYRSSGLDPLVLTVPKNASAAC